MTDTKKTVMVEGGFWMATGDPEDTGTVHYAIGGVVENLLANGAYFIKDPRTGKDDMAVFPLVRIDDPRTSVEVEEEEEDEEEEDAAPVVEEKATPTPTPAPPSSPAAPTPNKKASAS